MNFCQSAIIAKVASDNMPPVARITLELEPNGNDFSFLRPDICELIQIGGVSFTFGWLFLEWPPIVRVFAHVAEEPPPFVRALHKTINLSHVEIDSRGWR